MDLRKNYRFEFKLPNSNWPIPARNLYGQLLPSFREYPTNPLMDGGRRRRALIDEIRTGRIMSIWKSWEREGWGRSISLSTALWIVAMALKFLRPSVQEDAAARERFLRGAKAAAALDHPYICHIHEVGEAEGRAYIAMEFVRGETLTERLDRGAIPLEEALRILREITEALAKAHAHDIVHRDIKPSNIMFTDGGHVKVMDFGLAKRMTFHGEGDSQGDTRRPSDGKRPVAWNAGLHVAGAAPG